MFVLAVAPSLRMETPSVFFDQPDNVSYFHALLSGNGRYSVEREAESFKTGGRVRQNERETLPLNPST
jgi:hypothetical protein